MLIDGLIDQSINLSIDSLVYSLSTRFVIFRIRNLTHTQIHNYCNCKFALYCHYEAPEFAESRVPLSASALACSMSTYRNTKPETGILYEV
jgi:hypothetical protein